MSSIAGLLLWRKGWWLAGLLSLAGLGTCLADAAEVARPKAPPVVAAAEQTIPEEALEATGEPGAAEPIWMRTSREAEEAALAKAAAQRAAAQRALPPVGASRPAMAQGAGPPAAAPQPSSRRGAMGRMPTIIGPSGQSSAFERPPAATAAAPVPFAPNAAARLSAPPAAPQITRLPTVNEPAEPIDAPPPSANRIEPIPAFAGPEVVTASPAAPLSGFSHREVVRVPETLPPQAGTVAPAFVPTPSDAPAPAAIAEEAPAFIPTPAANALPALPANFTRGEAVAPPATPARLADPALNKPAEIQALLDKPAIAPPAAERTPAKVADDLPRVIRPQSQSDRMEPGTHEAPVIDAATARKVFGQQVSATGEAGVGAENALFRPRPQTAGEGQDVRPLVEPSQLDRPTAISSVNPIRSGRSNAPILAQVPPPAADPFGDDPLNPRRPIGPVAPGGEPLIDVQEQPFEPIDATGTLEVMLRRSLLLRTKADIYRTAVVDPTICDVVQFTPREISIIGKGQGATSVTFWFNDGRHRPVTYVVKVRPDIEERRRLEAQFKLLQDIVREQFPNSKVYLIPVADKLIIKGQARDGEEAAQIMAIVRGQTNSAMRGNQMYNLLAVGNAAQVLGSNETGRQPFPRIQVINMLRVPGVQQVALRTKIAELNRTAARGFGVDINANINFSGSTGLLLNSMLNAAGGSAPAILASFDGNDVQVGVRYLQERGLIRVLSEPTLVTMSGTSATFVAGGEFAVPTIVGSAGLNAVTTDFRAFGVILSFTPTVLDKDRIRLQVAPEFSQVNKQNAVNGIPGMNVRAVTTTVEMREGQTLAIAGLLDDSLKATTAYDLPWLAEIFGRRDVARNETELIILVSPELVHPMEPEEVPPLPGFDVTEPNNWDFFVRGKIEGNPTMEYRSTVWPRLKNRFGGSGMMSGPFGHGN